ncbi:MAG TPA: nucleotidyltransferase family protein [Methylomirabilota bacterium]|nr:nucleotidyltransferase family protein [Methylomirabilota bacterium]
MAQRIRQLVQERVDWNYLIQMAFYHGMTPLLFWNLSQFCPDNIPQPILSQLKASSNAVARWNLSLTRELLKLLNLFRDLGLRAIPFKGPVLTAAAYGNLALRYFDDLDILLPREDILEAKKALLLQGYRPKLQLTAGQETVYLRSHHDYKFIRANDGCTVELQWGVTQWAFAFPFDFDDMWERREIVSLAGVAVPNLPLEDLLLILCVHGAKHRWEQLKWICDIAELIAAYGQRIDWGRLTGQARALGGERMLLLGLFLAHDLLSAVLPEEVLKKIHNDPQVKLLAGQVGERLFCEASPPARLCDEPPFFYWKVREHWRDKLALWWRYFPEYFFRMIVPNERDREFWLLPSLPPGGYYLIRPVRLIGEYLPDFLRRPLTLRKGDRTQGRDDRPLSS